MLLLVATLLVGVVVVALVLAAVRYRLSIEGNPMTDTPKNIEDSEHPPTPEEGEHPPTATVVTTPDHSYIVVGLAGEPKAKLQLEQNTPTSILAFLQEAAKRLAAEDPKWGYVQAGPNERKTVTLPSNMLVAADTVMYETTHECIHILKNALEKGKDASPQWLPLPLPKFDANQWYPTKGEL